MASLYHLRECELGAGLAYKLAPFVRCYAPFDPLPTLAELRDAGYTRIEKESFVEDLTEEYFELHGHYPGEGTEVADS